MSGLLLYTARKVDLFSRSEERNLSNFLQILVQHALLAGDIHMPEAGLNCIGVAIYY